MAVTVDQILNSKWPLNFNNNFDSGCPCADIEGDGFKVEVHCWRTCGRCQFAGVHVDGLPQPLTAKIANHIAANNGWSGYTTFGGDVTVPEDVQDTWTPGEANRYE